MGHHFVPQRYLRNFEDPAHKGQVWLHVKGERLPRLVPVKAAAQAKQFYRDDHEGRLAREVETPGNAVIAKLVGAEQISTAERAQLTLYIGTMLMRVPARRRHAAKLIPEVLDETVAELRQQVLEFAAATGVSPELLAASLQTIEEVGAKLRDHPPASVVDQIADPFPRARVLEPIFSMTWRLLSSSERTFVTSDNPAFFFRSFGLGRPESELSFPLSSAVALHGCFQGESGSTLFVDANDRLVRELNRRTFSATDRMRFSDSPQRWLLEARPFSQTRLNRIHW